MEPFFEFIFTPEEWIEMALAAMALSDLPEPPIHEWPTAEEQWQTHAG